MNIYFVRHGETLQNAKGAFYGNMDVSLNEVGKYQIKKAAEYFKNINIDRVYISDRIRTKETADIILGKNKKVSILVDKRIRETNFGEFEGKNYEELKKLYPKECERWIEDWVTFCPPGGESYVQMYSRVKSFMEDIKGLTNVQNVLVVTHSGIIRAALCYVMEGNMELFWKFGCKNGDRFLVKYEYDNFYLDSIVHY